MMPILLNGGTTITINEATKGIKLGTLSGGNGTYEIYYSEDFYTGLFKTNSTNAQLVDGNELFLDDNWYLDYETKTYTKHIVNQNNGKISSTTYNSYSPTNAGLNPTVRIKSGSENQIFTISITDKNEAITVSTPTPLIQNRYGAVVAQVSPADNYFNTVYFQGPSIFEISGSNLKLTADYYYSENGWIINSAGSGFNTSNSSHFSDLKFILPTGYTSSTIDADGDGNADNGYTKLSVGSYLNSFFGSSNVNTSPQVTLSAINFLERDYGAIVATINYSGSETVSFSIKNHIFL